MRIAVIGTGIAGMVAAHLLAPDHDLVVFEANDYIGGHTRTVDVRLGSASFAVDTGFIVFNEWTYPNFVKLLKKLNVAWQPSRMSFSVKCARTGLEYSPQSPNALFARRSNLLRPAFYRMIREIFRFRRAFAALAAKENDETTLLAYLEGRGYSRMFIDKFVVPMGSAIWSADPAKYREFPAHYFARFFLNHGFLNLRRKPRWQVVKGGSKQYVLKLAQPYRERIRLQCPVQSVRRHKDHVLVQPLAGEAERFDQVIIATHSDQALTMLADPSDAERQILAAVPYQENEAVLHTDSALLPKRRSAWASWNSLIPREDVGRVTMTYDMNILQSLRAPVEFCVSLNVQEAIDPARILQRISYHHPVYTAQSPAAQRRRSEICGVNRTHFCGAYWGYGFHEDGVNSALAVCQRFGKTI